MLAPMARILPNIRPITRCVPLCTADLKFSPCLLKHNRWKFFVRSNLPLVDPQSIHPNPL
jgi:hypothetical protein